MAEKNNTNKMLSIGLVIVLVIAAVVMIYVNLPKEDTNAGSGEDTQDETADNKTEKPTLTLTMTYNNTDYQYNFTDIENLQSTTGTARYMKASPFLKTGTIIIKPSMNESANQYEGVKVSKLLDDINNIPETYNITISAPDGYSTIFNKSQINGNLVTYNETGNKTSVDVSVILAYKQNGEYLSEEDGPLMVAIVGNEPISLSNKWVSNVVKIEIE